MHARDAEGVPHHVPLSEARQPAPSQRGTKGIPSQGATLRGPGGIAWERGQAVPTLDPLSRTQSAFCQAPSQRQSPSVLTGALGLEPMSEQQAQQNPGCGTCRLRPGFSQWHSASCSLLHALNPAGRPGARALHSPVCWSERSFKTQELRTHQGLGSASGATSVRCRGTPNTGRPPC